MPPTPVTTLTFWSPWKVGLIAWMSYLVKYLQIRNYYIVCTMINTFCQQNLTEYLYKWSNLRPIIQIKLPNFSARLIKEYSIDSIIHLTKNKLFVVINDWIMNIHDYQFRTCQYLVILLVHIPRARRFHMISIVTWLSIMCTCLIAEGGPVPLHTIIIMHFLSLLFNIFYIWH